MKVNDAVSGALFIVIAILVFVYAGTFRNMLGGAYGPDLFPRIVAVMMVIGGASLVFGAMRPVGRRPWLELAEWARQPRSYILMLAVVSSMVFFILLSSTLGFLLTSFVLLTGLLVVTRGAGQLLSSSAIAAIVSVTAYLIFVRMLRVPLPFGVVELLLVG